MTYDFYVSENSQCIMTKKKESHNILYGKYVRKHCIVFRWKETYYKSRKNNKLKIAVLTEIDNFILWLDTYKEVFFLSK